VPLFIFLPRPFRLCAAAVTIVAQLLIIATSNHNFINLLTILLCLFLIDDRALARFKVGGVQAAPAQVPRASGSSSQAQDEAFGSGARGASVVFGPVALLVIGVSAATLWSAVAPRKTPAIVRDIADVASATGIGNVFHLFPTMQTERQELRIFGRAEGGAWEEYVFRYKPGAADRAPGFIVPHQPRLDWMMWFLPPQSPRTGFWLEPLLQGLRENRPPVTALFAHNPFASRPPPTEMRVLAYRYRFTSPAQREATGNWWQVELLGEYPDVVPRRP
jgi:lipase maturation factor 1